MVYGPLTTLVMYNDTPETLYHRDNALLYIAYVMLIWAAPNPADRWYCSHSYVAEISCALIVHYRFSAECIYKVSGYS